MIRTRTRFAPSPTGYLHIGGLRTALFSYLYARHEEGDFILRIEDTDRARYVEGAIDDIIESLKWLGIEWDEGPDRGGQYGPYLQSERKERYRVHAHRLIETGHAYKCFCSPQRLKALREAKKNQGGALSYDRHCRNLSTEEVQSREQAGESYVIRLKVPEEGETTFEDAIRGIIKTDNAILDDMILLKSDGFPTYHLANVVDDHLMHITHVIRGDEWISSTPRHMLLYKGFGWNPPVFAHVPVILAQGGGKLSKRHGATMVREFRQKGYLGEALLNFISLLGWSLDDKTELFTMSDLVKYFDLKKVNKAPAVFSYEKLDWFNGVYIRKKSTPELYELVLPYLIAEGVIREDEVIQYKEYILKIIPLIRERMKFLSDAPRLLKFFFDQHYSTPEAHALIPKKHTKQDARAILEHAIGALESIECFDEQILENTFSRLIESLGMKTGPVFMTLRVALTGTTVSPGLFETMNVLGEKRVLNRLNSALETIRGTDEQ
jgi:glutamyl-tRNA synthetase